MTPDSLVLLLLCSKLGLDADSSPKPLTAREWTALERRLRDAGWQPADLLTLNEAPSSLPLAPAEMERLRALLARDLNTELERLAALDIYPLTRADADYPPRYIQRLKESAPPVLFYAGERALLGQPGLAVVGSRHLDEVGEECARFVGNACGLSGLVLYSGGARGVDTLSLDAALEARGTGVIVLADSLERMVRRYRMPLERGDLCLVTPYHPNAGFSIGMAMGRNRLIYTLADYALVVASDVERGGTWAGATEALKHGWVPVFVLQHPHMPEGNRRLLEQGASPFPYPFSFSSRDLPGWLAQNSRPATTTATQLPMF